MKRNLSIVIGVAAAIAFFLLFFGQTFFPFPRIFVLDIFQRATVGQVQQAQQPEVQQQPAPQQGKEEERLNGLVRILTLVEGTGREAVVGSEVAVGYVGVFTDEQTGQPVEFDRNTERETPFIFTLGSGQVVPGFEAGIEGMREGDVRVLQIAPEVAYGSQQVGNIPPNTTLQFIVELYEVR